MRVRSLSLLAVAIMAIAPGQVRGVPEEDESLGQKIKKLFVQPTPYPRKKHKASPSPSPKKKTTPKPSPSASPKPSPSAAVSPSASPFPSPSPSSSPSPKKTPSVTATPLPSETPAESPHRRRPLSEPIRAISPGPRRRHIQTPPEGVTIPHRQEEEASPGQTPRSALSVTPSATIAPVSGKEEKGKGTRGPVATVSASEIAGYENYAPSVRKILDRALSLTTQNLGYKYGSADPANGGMDCSGFINYVLSQSGMANVPRDAREQYIWVRKAGTFQAVLAHSDTSFELDALKPGDLLFWSGTYYTDKDPAITHTMIYLGREKGTKQRIMVGSSDGRSYKGQSRFGVSVFDFKIAARITGGSEDHPGPVFVGYGRIPGLDETR